jgi:hypothetical protein
LFKVCSALSDSVLTRVNFDDVSSDLHVDSNPKHQMQWLIENCIPILVDPANVFNILILPGDIGTDMLKLQLAFQELSTLFDALCYVPGNHEAWVLDCVAGHVSSAYNSVHKLNDINDMISTSFSNIYCGPLKVVYPSIDVLNGTREVVILPLQGWYHASWDKEPSITNSDYLAVEKHTPFHSRWIDYRACKWPEDVVSLDEVIHQSGKPVHNNNVVLAERFAQSNEHLLHVPPVDLESCHHELNSNICNESKVKPWHKYFGCTLTTPSSGK